MPEYHWQGDNPYFLAIRRYHKERVGLPDGPEGPTTTRRVTTVIDLDEPGWLDTYAHLMRVPATWMLCDKVRSDHAGVIQPVLIVRVYEGEQPYYTKKHIGILPFGGGDAPPPDEVLCYGIGKKRRDGQTDRLWIMPNGMIAVGEDVYDIGADMVKGQL